MSAALPLATGPLLLVALALIALLVPPARPTAPGPDPDAGERGELAAEAPGRAAAEAGFA